MNWREASLDEQEKALLEFSEKLTLTPALMKEADLDALRRVGFDESQILAIVLEVGNWNFITRVADMLGVELNDQDYSEEILNAFGVSKVQQESSIYGAKS